MAEFSVTITELKNRSESLTQMNGQFLSQVNGLIETESALNGMWEGEAKEAFHSAFSKDITQMNNFYNAIGQYVTALNNIIERYSAAEAQNVEIAINRNY